MKHDFYYPSHDGKTIIHAAEWLPKGKPSAILQLCHGMCEHIGRYDDFASFLAENGFYVVGNDHLGHGASVISEEELGYFAEKDGNLCVLKDLHTLRRTTERRFPHVPYFILGHSMGSYLLRQYIARCGKGLTGVIVMGTGSETAASLAAGKAICRSLASVRGWHFRSKIVDAMVLGEYSKAFSPYRTVGDWLTRDEAIVDACMADPLCNYVFTVNGYYNLFLAVEDAQSEPVIAAIPKNLPILIISGEKDPVGNFGKGVREVFRTYQTAGIVDLEIKLYEDDRHEILNELDRDEVYQYLLRWLMLHLPEQS
ncbi:MAG: alpha/beta hydrolase [Oscillospiraceae bacterium]|nr:alpha/beta hydrolase [Oscillospiraceae bacterium]